MLPLPKGLPAEAVAVLESLAGDVDGIVQTFFRIKNKAGQLVNFVYNRPQRLHAQRSTDFDIVLKARKEGISSRRIARDLVVCATTKNQHRILLTHTDEAAVKMMNERVLPLINNCRFPLNARPKISEGMVYFPLTESRYYLNTAGAKKFGRGDDVTGYHFSEYAHWASPEVVGGVEEALLERADGLIETTANGHNFFRKDWMAAKNGQNRYRAIFLPWYASEDYEMHNVPVGPLSEEEQALMQAFNLTEPQLAWMREKKRTMRDPSLFPQEYPSTDEGAFLSTGRPVFDSLSLYRLKSVVTPPKWRGYLVRRAERIDFVPDPSGPLRVWRVPERDHVYGIGADVAEGLPDGAFSTGEVLDLGDSEQVAEWHGHNAPDLHADVLELLAGWYNQAVIVPEAWPGPGGITTSHLAGKQSVKVWQAPDSDRIGWQTTEKTKPLAIASLNAALRDQGLTVRSQELLDELHAYVYDERGRMEPSSGNFSDRLMGMAIVWYATRDMASRIDYYKARHPILLGEEPVSSRGGTSVPKFTGRRLGVRPGNE